MQHPLISVVAPVYNESDGIGEFYARVTKVMTSIQAIGYEIIFVDDGSADDSYRKLRKIAEEDSHVQLARFSRNFGHQMAITAGIDLAQGDAVIVIDSDLQDPPEVMAEFISKWREGYDVAYGVRKSRAGESAFKLITARVFYRLMGSLSTIEIPMNVGDFRLMGRPVVDQLRQLREQDRYIRGLVSWIGFKQIGVHYERDARTAGETKFSLRKMLGFALDGMTSFSLIPLRLATWVGYATSALAFIYLINVFIERLQGITVQGWASIMVAVLFIGGIQLICLGIIGEYIGRIFNQSKQRPLYIIAERFRRN
jgi:glycosyltransferase involved in cell wall biosynthesis